MIILNLDSQMTQEPLNLSCFLIGDDNTFVVEIDASKQVGNLVNEIKKARGRLNDVEPTSITLYMAEIDNSLDWANFIDELQRRSQDLVNCIKLSDAERSLSVIFGNTPEGKYIIVQISKGESIKTTTVCGTVDETVPTSFL